MASPRPSLAALAERLGILDGYVSALDGRPVPTQDRTREALCAAMGHDGSSEASAESALRELGPPDPGPSETPPCLSFRERLGDRHGFGLWSNLYSVRSSRNLGFGNLADLGILVDLAGRHGAAFVAVNPLHALTHRSDGLCPYAPVSRLFRSPLYLDVEQILAVDGCAETERELGQRTEQVRQLRASAQLDPQAVEQVLYALLRPVHARFRARPADDPRRQAHARYRAARGEALEDFATYQALADVLEPQVGGRDWRSWPDRFARPDRSAVRSFRAEHAQQVEFHAWLQFELDAQLDALGQHAARQGLSIGLYTDLALGSAPGGFDTWAYCDLFARGVSLGAPPDEFARSGQSWGIPPLDPHALRREGFAFWRRLLEANVHAAGALRIDHSLGLRRLFWIPDGAPPGEGAYVRAPELELVAVLAQVSRERGVLIIGEDLGTIPEGFSETMQRRGILSSRVLLFERDGSGYRASDAWPEACLATVNTHDLPPLAGWLEATDIHLRRATGQIPDDAGLEVVSAQRRDDLRALHARLMDEHDFPRDGHPEDPTLWVRATAQYLCRTPAVLVGLSLDDLASERVPINLPGVSHQGHPSWARRMERSLEELGDDPALLRVLDSIPEHRRLR